MSWGRFFALSLPLALSLGLAQPWSPLASFEPLSMRIFGPFAPIWRPLYAEKGTIGQGRGAEMEKYGEMEEEKCWKLRTATKLARTA